MIGRISGTLVEKRPPGVMIDVQGVAYEIDVPMSTFYELPAIGAQTKLLTHMVVREDAQLLYGFSTAAERAGFRQLIKISGIGARIALAILSGLSMPELATAIAEQDVARLTRVPGIGKKTGERLLLELKGKLQEHTSEIASSQSPDPVHDVINALISLGYSERDAKNAVEKLPPGTDLDDGIRQTLKFLTK